MTMTQKVKLTNLGDHGLGGSTSRGMPNFFPSKISKKAMERAFVEAEIIVDNFHCILPKPPLTANNPPPGHIAVYTRSLSYGQTIPFHPFVKRFIRLHNISCSGGIFRGFIPGHRPESPPPSSRVFSILHTSARLFFLGRRYDVHPADGPKLVGVCLKLGAKCGVGEELPSVVERCNNINFIVPQALVMLEHLWVPQASPTIPMLPRLKNSGTSLRNPKVLQHHLNPNFIIPDITEAIAGRFVKASLAFQPCLPGSHYFALHFSSVQALEISIINYMETASLIERVAEAESVKKKLRDEVTKQINKKNKLKEDIDVKLGREFLLTEEFEFKVEEVVNKFKASEEFKQERLALMKAIDDQILEKSTGKGPILTLTSSTMNLTP
ncbi:hypothetical protein TIFTF001_037170 [Ficus carica]|uniref:Uncharacterized protein n=1 Tax=Ficus carica TaxID=3494 RepID=A0AA88E9B9_FICCA|nr:hypothetical protein TIFTF001_037170 [Ficus carica]